MGRVVLGGGMVVVVRGGMVIEVGGALGIAIWTAVFSPPFILQHLSLLRSRHHNTTMTMMAMTAPLERTSEIWCTPSTCRPPLSPVFSTTGVEGGGYCLELHIVAVGGLTAAGRHVQLTRRTVLSLSGGVELADSSLIRPLQSELAYVRLIIIYMTLLLSHPPMPGGLGKPAGVGRGPGDGGAVVVGKQGDSCPLPGIAHNSFVSKVGVKPHADNAVGKP